MDKSILGPMVGAYKTPTGPLSLEGGEEFTDILAQLDSKPSFLPSVMVIVPQYYKDRSGQRVDICGTVDENTIEYSQGLRYFDINATFFHEKGNREADRKHVDDLCETVSAARANELDAPVSVHQWVHPQHVQIKTFFREINPDVNAVACSRFYLNRMGFVVEIVDEQTDESGVVYLDAQDTRYTREGHAADITSMRDLLFEIRNYALFSRQDWTTAELSLFQEDNLPPELFNPTLHNRPMLLKELLTHILRAHEIGNQLGIDVGFRMNTDLLA